MQDLLDDRLGETEDDLLYPFPFRGMRMLNRCDYYKPAGRDPRGPKFDDGEDLPLASRSQNEPLRIFLIYYKLSVIS